MSTGPVMDGAPTAAGAGTVAVSAHPELMGSDVGQRVTARGRTCLPPRAGLADRAAVAGLAVPLGTRPARALRSAPERRPTTAPGAFATRRLPPRPGANEPHLDPPVRTGSRSHT
jgi:hypothetical protein